MIRNNFGLKKLYSFHRGIGRVYSTMTYERLSYYHRVESEPFKYLSVGQLLQWSAEKYGEKIALIAYSENKRLSFSEALRKADSLASSLLNLGLEKGDRVAIWSPNYEFWYISMLAVIRAGLICTTINPAYTLHELNYCLDKVDVKAVIAPESYKTQKYYEMLLSRKDKSDCSLKFIIIYGDKCLPGSYKFDDLLHSTESDIRNIKGIQLATPDDVCMIQFTSGTTGKPKAACLSHFGIVNNSYSIGLRNEFHKKETKICMPLPFFHVGGCVISIVGSLHHGFSLVLPAPHYDSELILKSMVDERCNTFVGTPTFAVDVIAKNKYLNLQLPPIDLVCLGGADLSPQLVQDLIKNLKAKRVTSVYGLTETSSAIFQTLPEDSNESVQEFVGMVGNNVEAKVIDRKGNIVPFGQPGELCIRSSVNMIKYWQDPDNTLETLGEDKWLKTGDQFILYENGYGKICGRLKDMIIRGGENIFPKEIEDFLNTHENILESQVVGIPDERMGEEIVAFCRLKDESKSFTTEDVKAYCKGNLAHFKIPKYTAVVKDFPRTQSGKIQKYAFLDYFKDALQDLK